MLLSPVMIIKSGLFQLIILISFSYLIILFLKQFKIKAKKSFIFIIPLITYSLGFYLRIGQNQDLIDLGFFFTELSSLFVTIIFSICLFLGQIKYWQIK